MHGGGLDALQSLGVDRQPKQSPARADRGKRQLMALDGLHPEQQKRELDHGSAPERLLSFR